MLQRLTSTISRHKSELKHVLDMHKLEQAELDGVKSQHAHKMAELERTQRALLEVGAGVFTFFIPNPLKTLRLVVGPEKYLVKRRLDPSCVWKNSCCRGKKKYARLSFSQMSHTILTSPKG